MIIQGPEEYRAHANCMCVIYNNVIVICLVIVPTLYSFFQCCRANCHKFGNLKQLLSQFLQVGQVWPSWMFCSEPHKAEIQVPTKVCFFLEPKIHLQTHVAVGRMHFLRMEVPISCQMSARGHSQQLETAALPCHVILSTLWPLLSSGQGRMCLTGFQSLTTS